MKRIVLGVLVLGLSSCVCTQKHVATEQVKPAAERTVANDPTVIKIRLNRTIPGFNNDQTKEATPVVYAKNEVNFNNKNFACYIQMKTPANTKGILRASRLFYAKMGNCKVFDRFSTAENFCDTPVLHLFNSEADIQQKKVPVGTINSWVPGNPSTYDADNTAEYSALIKACFDIDTKGVNHKIPYSGTTQTKDL